MKKALMSCLLFFTAANLYGQSTVDYTAAKQLANQYIVDNHLKLDQKKNVCLGQYDKVIHIFLFQDGNQLIGGYPTTATEQNFFAIHLYVTDPNDSYVLDYTGTYQPAFNIQGGASTPQTNAILKTNLTRIDFPVLGPFTTSLSLTIKKADATGNYKSVTTSTIQISKTFYASIGSGFVFTSLKNPKNVKAVPTAGGDSTLLADDANGRTLLTIMATFYPWGRNNLMMPSWGFKDRFGIIVGTTLGTGSSNFGDILVGGQYDFSIGGSLVAGLHYGRRQRISGIDYSSYKFGEDKFTGVLANKLSTGWDAGFFFGVQIDSRIFSQLFK